MKEKVMNIIKKTAETVRKNPIIAIVAAVAVIAVVLLVVLIVTNKDTVAPAQAQSSQIDPAFTVSGTVGNTSMTDEEVAAFDFSLSNTPQTSIDSAVAFVNQKVDEEAAQPYVVSFSKDKVYASEEATVWFRRTFFRSDYSERNNISDAYINQNIIAVLAEYTVDYDQEQVPYEDGKTTKAYYLMKTELTDGWTVYKTETLSVE